MKFIIAFTLLFPCLLLILEKTKNQMIIHCFKVLRELKTILIIDQLMIISM